MADFKEVARTRQEICEWWKNTHHYIDGCERCPIYEVRESGGCRCQENIMTYPDEYESVIMNWQKPVDWSKVPVDTKVLVRDEEYDIWQPRHFAKYENGKVHVFTSGKTSWTVSEESGIKIVPWSCAKLAD